MGILDPGKLQKGTDTSSNVVVRDRNGITASKFFFCLFIDSGFQAPFETVQTINADIAFISVHLQVEVKMMWVIK